jgi:hypothetical protein
MNNIISQTICIDVEDIESFTDIEKEFSKEVKKAFNKVAKKIMKLKEEKILKEKKYIKKCKVSRYLYTLFGQIRYSRYKAEDRNGKISFPLDRCLGIKKHSSFSPAVESRAIYLATLYPYRQAESILSYEIAEDLDHKSLWRLVQKRGRALRAEKKAKVEKIYTNAEKVSSKEKKEIIIIEADGTGISSNKGKGKWMEAKIGIIYTGKRLESKTAKHKRYALEDKTVYADILDMDEFGKNLSYIAEEKYSLSSAENVLTISDGAGWLKKCFGGYFPGSAHQLDHYHLKKKLKTIYSDEPYLLDRALNLINKRKEKDLIDFISLSKENGAIDAGGADDAITYIESNLSSIWAVDKLRGKAPNEVLVTGSGAIEKNVDINIARRFKGRGMNWSNTGARNLIALRMLVVNGQFDKYFSKAA